MTHQEMFDEASAAGLSAADMAQNCRDQLAYYFRAAYWTAKRARRRPPVGTKTAHEWRCNAYRCARMLRWLAAREA